MLVSYKLLDLKQKTDLNKVGWFFRQEGDRLGFIPMLFDFDRWGQCEEAIIAEVDSEVVGVVTIAFCGINKSGKPTIDTLYVPHRFGKQGIGFTLFERAMRRILERRSTARVFCDLHSSLMMKLVSKLPSDLRNWLDVVESDRYGDVAVQIEQAEENCARKMSDTELRTS
jgi:hypothetical protein